MRFFCAIAVVSAFQSYVSALPIFGLGAGNGCLTKHSAYELVKNFIKLTNGDGFNETLANALIAEDVVDTSGSVASVINGGMHMLHISKILELAADSVVVVRRRHCSGSSSWSNAFEQN